MAVDSAGVRSPPPLKRGATTRQQPQSQPQSQSLAAAPAAAKITVFVSTCQVTPFETAAASSHASASSTASSAFRPVKFQAIVAPTAPMAELRRFLVSQWVISKSPFAQLPLDEQFFTFKGRILRMDGALDGYYIAEHDTIYLRFASLGRVCDPWAMSTSELRAELKARDAYVPQLQPEQLMLRLQELVMRESRMQRLQRATKQEAETQVESITKELARLSHSGSSASPKQQRHVLLASHPSSGKSNGAFSQRPASLQWPHAPSPSRTVFLSIAQLERDYQRIPRDVLDPAILIFDTERKWVFDKHNALQKQDFDYRYMCLDADFLEFLTLKEEMGLVFWFRPHKSYEKLSVFFEGIEDPVSLKRFAPLLLKETKWLTLCGVNGWEGKVRQDGRKRDTSKVPKFTRSVARVTTNLQSRSFEYVAVQELLYQSNPTLLFAPL